MILSNKELLELSYALGACSKQETDSTVSYGLARNIKKVNSALKSYNEAESARLETFCEKDEKGNYKTEGNQYVFKDKQAAIEKHNELMKEEVEIEFYHIKRSDSTDKLPPIAQSVLLDLIIIE